MVMMVEKCRALYSYSTQNSKLYSFVLKLLFQTYWINTWLLEAHTICGYIHGITGSHADEYFIPISRELMEFPWTLLQNCYVIEHETCGRTDNTYHFSRWEIFITIFPIWHSESGVNAKIQLNQSKWMSWVMKVMFYINHSVVCTKAFVIYSCVHD